MCNNCHDLKKKITVNSCTYVFYVLFIFFSFILQPGESGFVIIGDVPLETSTDPDDYYSMGPPSPCDIEFENWNIIIDGKSSIRRKNKDLKVSLIESYLFPE